MNSMASRFTSFEILMEERSSLGNNDHTIRVTRMLLSPLRYVKATGALCA